MGHNHPRLEMPRSASTRTASSNESEHRPPTEARPTAKRAACIAVPDQRKDRHFRQGTTSAERVRLDGQSRVCLDGQSRVCLDGQSLCRTYDGMRILLVACP
jgi:hypothetical protein